MEDFSTLCMGIPTVNQAELLNTALKTYKDTFYGRHIIIIDNGNQAIDKPTVHTRVIQNKSNIGVAASWNVMCKMAFHMGYSHIAIINDDVISQKYADDLEDYIDDIGAGLYLGYKNFSMFILSLKTYDLVGKFDENFKGAYFEDKDYLWRCKQEGVIIEQSEILNPEVFYSSKSIEKDPSLNKNFESNKQYYIEKWGGVPSEEKFTKPFNK
jgi:hypothetical protein